MRKMRKMLGVALVLLLCLGVVGCTTQEASSTTPEAVKPTETVAPSTEQPEPTKNENLREYNKVLVDNENLRAELLSIEYTYEKPLGHEVVEVTFDIINKQDFPIEVQARSVSINNRMVEGDDVLVAMSQEVGPGKSAYAVLSIQNFGDKGRLKLEGNFEMTLHIFNWDDWSYKVDIPVSVPLD